MTRWYARLANKRFLFFMGLSSAAVLLTLQAPRTFSKSTETAANKHALTELNVIPRMDPGYSIQDGLVTDGYVSTFTDVGEAGNVDKLDLSTAYARAEQMGKQAQGRVFKEKLAPHWFDNNTKLWYCNDTKDGTKDFVVVDAQQGSKNPAFDHEKLAAGLSKATNSTFQGNKLPFDNLEFVDGTKAILVTVGEKNWKCDLTSYDCIASKIGPKVEAKGGKKGADALPPVDEPRDPFANSYDPLVDDELSPEERDEQKGKQKADPKKAGGGGKGPAGATKEASSPDGNWTAFVKEKNVWVRDKDGREFQMTKNGVDGDAYRAVTWSPDSKVVVTYRSTPGDNKTVYFIETSPPDQLYTKYHERAYPRAMDKMATHEMWLVRVDDLNLKPIKVDIERIDFRGIPRLRWSKDSATFTFEKTDRGHQRFRVVEVDARKGLTRNIIDEKSDSMVNHYADVGEKNHTFYLQYLDDTDEIVYLSEMDGWKHLYLIDAKAGKIKNQMTKGEWVVRKINKMDTKNRQMWFQGSGKNTGQDPYLIQYYRVNFDGTGLVALTAGDGDHTIQYSPDQKYIVASFSRVDMAPVHELRRVSDGTKVCDLEKADVTSLEATGWKYPEVFSAKGRDGKTDIWGIVYRPQKMDPNKKYPVIEYIYAGPHSSHVPKSFAATRGMATLAEMGFIVVQIDGMGTMNRSKAFHAVCWQNLKDAGFPDRILWIKALAKKYEYVDVTRVGIYGTSAGGQNACGALLFHPEFYKVAVSACGCHDNALDKSSWNESWMGKYGPHYVDSSNITHAKNLQGHLLLIVGEMDTNVPPESTYRVVDALIKAKKDFDFIAVPGAGHSSGGAHGERRKIDFFMQHLQGVSPANHNLPGAVKKGKGGEE